MEILILLGIVGIIAIWAYRAGKGEGSRKGFHAGRQRTRRRR